MFVKVNLIEVNNLFYVEGESKFRINEQKSWKEICLSFI